MSWSIGSPLLKTKVPQSHHKCKARLKIFCYIPITQQKGHKMRDLPETMEPVLTDGTEIAPKGFEFITKESVGEDFKGPWYSRIIGDTECLWRICEWLRKPQWYQSSIYIRPIPEKAEEVKEAMRQYLDGEKIKPICAGCGDKGFQTRSDGIRIHCPMCHAQELSGGPVYIFPPQTFPVGGKIEITCKSNP